MLVLENGGSDRSIYIQMPTALSIPMNMPKYNWFYHTEPEPGLGGRSLHTPRGKVLGGSSSINGLVYVRGNPFDFDRWEEEGARGWSYHHVLPYFRRAEKRAGGGDEYHGDSGKLLHHARVHEQSFESRLDRSGTASGLSGHCGYEWLSAGRLRRDGYDRRRRPAV